MKKQILIFIWGITSIISANAQTSEVNNALKHVDHHFFIENKGQWPDEVLYLSSIGGLDAWITRNGVLYDFYKPEEVTGNAKTEESIPKKFKKKDFTRIGHKVCYKFHGNNKLVYPEGKEKQEGYYNYLIGNDQSKHASNVGLFKEALVKNVYKGIDVRYYFDKGSIRYDYIVHPGADPSQIAFALEGTDKTYLNAKGDLAFNTRFGEVTLAELHTYQGSKGNKVNSRFVRTEKGWSITLGPYDRKQTLIIDPLIYSTYLGGGNLDYGSSIDIDASGNVYITGITYSLNYDITPGAYQRYQAGGDYDIFVTKLNSSGTALIYSTFLGGNDYDYCSAAAIDTFGNTYVTGYTISTNYISSSGAYQTSHEGGYSDVFVTKLNTTGTALVYSTYLGGSDEEEGQSIAIDASGNAYVTGYTISGDFDTTSGVYQTSSGGDWDIFVTKLNTTGTALVYSTYLGGYYVDYAYSIALDPSDNAYITGYTNSSDYDITTGAYQTSYAGGNDAFVSKLNNTGTALVYSTYLGGNGYEYGFSIALDTKGNAYFTGVTSSTNYSTTKGAYKASRPVGYNNVFVTKLNTTGTALVYSTYLGGDDIEYGTAIALDASGNAFITGHTKSTNYHITSGAYQTSLAGNIDIFVTKLNSRGTALIYSSYLGDNADDFTSSIAIDASGNNVYVTGYTNSQNYDITPGAYQTSLAGNFDVFVTRICLIKKATMNLSSSIGTDSQSVCKNGSINNITYATTEGSAASFSGLPPGLLGSFASNTISISGTLDNNASGTYHYTVNLTGGCETTTAKGSITVKPEGTIDLLSASGTDSQSICIHHLIADISYTYESIDPSAITITGLAPGLNYSFGTNTLTISGAPTASGIYDFTITLSGDCKTIYKKGRIHVKPYSTINLTSGTGTDSQSVCIHGSINKITYVCTDASSASFSGLPSGLSGSFADNEVSISGIPTVSGSYNYIITLKGDCGTLSRKGHITIKPETRVSLSSSAGTDSQNICIRTAIKKISYTTTDASAASASGLAPGLSSSFANNALSISGTATTGGIYTYTITFTGGCKTVTTIGSISVKTENTINLSSSQGTDAQSVNINSPISNISYATTGANGASVSGLPLGVIGKFTANTVSISGTPIASGIFPYTVTLNGGCDTIKAKGIIHVRGLGIADQTLQVLQIFPNPSDIEVSVKGAFSASVQIEIIDALGRVSQADYSIDGDTILLKVSSLENGVYCIRITDNGQVFQGKIIVQH